MNKIIEGAKQAVEAAKCDHDLSIIARPTTTTPTKFDRFACSKCMAIIWVPVTSQASPPFDKSGQSQS